MNQRTMETRYYEVEGAIEDSAMSSAQGQVQHLNYQATFPLLLNIADEPTYFMALKDQAGLVKMYAMVNVQKYQIVATGDTIKECEQSYREILLENGIIDAGEVNTKPEEPDVVVPEMEVNTISGTILEIYPLTVDGDSSLYVKLSGGDSTDCYYWINLTEGRNVIALNYQIGDIIEVIYKVTEDVIRQVVEISKK